MKNFRSKENESRWDDGACGVDIGHVVFHGPKDAVMPFFNSLGFQLPERKGIADFLQEVTSPKDQEVSFLC